MAVVKCQYASTAIERGRAFNLRKACGDPYEEVGVDEKFNASNLPSSLRKRRSSMRREGLMRIAVDQFKERKGSREGGQ